MTLVVDASVALKWFSAEADRESARALLQGQELLLAPDLVIAETTNAVWKGVQRGLLTPEQGAEITAILPRCFTRLVPGGELASRALEIAFELDHPAYDGFYLALAEREDAPMITADDRLFRKTRRTAFAKRVQQLNG